MFPRFKSTISILLIVLLNFVSLPIQARIPQFRVLVRSVIGDSFLEENDGTRVVLLAGDVLVEGDKIIITDQGEVGLVFSNGAIANVVGVAEFTIPNHTYNRETRFEQTSSLYLVLGTIWVYVVNRLVGERGFSIETPTAVTGVRGTMFSLEVTEQRETLLNVYRGSVEFENLGGEKITVKGGFQSQTVESAITPPIPLSSKQEEGHLFSPQNRIITKKENMHQEQDEDTVKDEKGSIQKPGGPPANVPPGPDGLGPPGLLKKNKVPPGLQKKQNELIEGNERSKRMVARNHQRTS